MIYYLYLMFFVNNFLRLYKFTFFLLFLFLINYTYRMKKPPGNTELRNRLNTHRQYLPEISDFCCKGNRLN